MFRVLPVFSNGWFRVWYPEEWVYFFTMTAEQRHSPNSPFGCVDDEVIFVGGPRRPGCRRQADKVAGDCCQQQKALVKDRSHFGWHGLIHYNAGCNRTKIQLYASQMTKPPINAVNKKCTFSDCATWIWTDTIFVSMVIFGRPSYLIWCGFVRF